MVVTLLRRLERLEQREGGGDGGNVTGVVHDDDADTDRPGVVTVQPSGERVSVSEFHRRWPRGLLVIRQTWGTPDDAA
jgi:hypothetical protein